MKFKAICKKISDVLLVIFGWGIFLSLFAGGLTFFGFVVALCIGGDTGAAISVFIYKSLFPKIINVATVMVLVGLLAMYLKGENALTMGKKKKAK